MNVNDIVEQQIAAAGRKQQAQQQRRAALKTARNHGLTQRHRSKIAHIGTDEQHGVRLALAALNRDHETLARLLDYADDRTVRNIAAVALGAVAELALTARPVNLTRTRDALARMADSGPEQTP
ncbi:hypothetical protein [Streptomyces sp. NPDC059165]|uniref:hypothetical protein n=1 Tax=Streptomyces sp. NPDC059165 TaxID=3346751 RepID=UPI0036881A8D